MGNTPLKGTDQLPVVVNKSFFIVDVSLPFLWSFKVFAVIAKDFSAAGLFRKSKSSPWAEYPK